MLEKLIKSCLIFTLLVFIAGCNSMGEGKIEAPREMLMLWSYYETEAQRESLNQLVAEFNKTQDKYLVTWEYVPMTEFSKRIAIGITENQLPDLVIIDNPDMSSYIELGAFEEITDYIDEAEADSYYKSVWESVEHKGKIFGLPFCSNNLALIYNKDIFNKNHLSPPKDWQEFISCSQVVSSGSGYGFAMSGINGEQSAFQLFSWLLASGEQLESLGGRQTVLGLQRLSEMIDAGMMPVESINWSQNDLARKFIEGNLAMMENGPWILPILKEAKVNYGIIPLPHEAEKMTVVGGENLCVIKGKNLEGAIEFIKYYSQDEVTLKVCKAAYAIPPKVAQAELLAGQEEEYQVFVDGMKTSLSRAAIKDWKERSKKLSQVMYDLLSGQKTAEQAAEDLKE